MKPIPAIQRSGIRERARGFTLVELLSVLAIIAVLAGAAAPAMSGLIRSAKLSSASNDLFSSLLMARSEAVKRNSRVVLCKSSNGVTCTAGGGWEQGWIVFHDADNSGTREVAEEIILRGQALSGDLRLSGNLNVARYVSYSASGTTKLASGAFQAGTITMCNASPGETDARQIVLNASGRPRVQKTRVATCA